MAMEFHMQATSYFFSDDGDIPNHPRWPMIVYGGAVEASDGDAAEAFEQVFARNGWGNGWRNGIFAFPHYHSNAHEALGIARGAAEVRFGGAAGKVLSVHAGDAVLLPAGTGHELVSSSSDLLVIGAYPPGTPQDLMRAGESDKSEIRRRIKSVPRPATDPITGAAGPVLELWDAEQ
jgi:uncharacterized protein YjlB